MSEYWLTGEGESYIAGGGTEESEEFRESPREGGCSADGPGKGEGGQVSWRMLCGPSRSSSEWRILCLGERGGRRGSRGVQDW